MKLRLLTARTANSGPSGQFGDIIDVEDDREAWRMIQAGQAEQIGPETAMVEQKKRGRPPARGQVEVRQ